jgi:anion-transporting  ArsA/GET3 family ATPase
VLDKRLVFVTGKGGVGRTTVAAALGLAAARRGKRTILCELAEQERTSSGLGREGVGHRETEVAPGLWAVSIDTQRALEEYLREAVGSRTLYTLLFQNRIFQYLAAAAPGVRELVTIGKVWELAQLQRWDARNSPYDLVVVDAPATGHGLALLRTPRTFSRVARVGPIRRRAENIERFLRNSKRTGVVTVALAEEMPVTETLEFRTALAREMDMTIDAVVVNALYPERFSAGEAAEIDRARQENPTPAVRAALDAGSSEHRQARAQRRQLRRLRRAAAGLESVTLPFLFDAEPGLDAWQRLSSELERRL